MYSKTGVRRKIIKQSSSNERRCRHEKKGGVGSKGDVAYETPKP